jgi:hypothetical protein
MRGVLPRLPSAILCFFAIFFLAEAGSAQACLGSPALPGQFALGGQVSFTDGATGFGGGVTANLANPLAIGAFVEITDVDGLDKNITTVGGTVAYELPLAGVSGCPIAGVSYSTFGDTFDGIGVDISRVALPIGFGLGASLDLQNNMVLIPSGSVQLLYFRDKVSASFAGETFSESDTSTEVGASIGATLGLGQFFGRGAVSLTTIEDSDPVVSITIGLRF